MSTLWGADAAEDENPRRKRKHVNKDDPHRDRWKQDSDRVLYSAGFRRLAGITQIAAAGEAALLHNRLTHSLKVAQVGRRIAEKLLIEHPEYADRLNPDVVETAGMAHDLGHPPYGHAVEKVLDKVLSGYKAGGFEGNAQTFRYVTKTAVRRLEEDVPGRGSLDLTRASLNAIIKYPQCECDELPPPNDYVWHDRMVGPPGKWNAYDVDQEIFRWAREGLEPGVRTLEAAIMDWSDDISYAVHDIEDYVRARLIPAHALETDASRLKASMDAYMADRYDLYGLDEAAVDAAFDWLLKYMHRSDPYSVRGADEDHWNQWVSTRITECLEATGTDAHGRLEIDVAWQYRIELLKRLPVIYVIEAPAFAAAQLGQGRTIRRLFRQLMEMYAALEQSIPTSLSELIKSIRLEPSTAAERLHNPDYDIARSVSDYLCTLTERQTEDLAALLEGSAPSMFHGRWL